MARDRLRTNLPPADLTSHFERGDPIASECPMCGGVLVRARRRFIDRLLSVFTPVHRFRCINFGCGHECNLGRSSARRSAS